MFFAPSQLPKLSNPSLFWRCAALLLGLVAVSPGSVGSVVYETNGTLRGIMRMACSGISEYPGICETEETEKEERRRRDGEVRKDELLTVSTSYLVVFPHY